MTLLQRFAAATLLLAGTAGMASAQGSGKNDSVDYAPRVNTVAGTLPLTAAYQLSISAPTQMNKKSVDALPSGEVAMRNSRDPDGPALVFTRPEWDAFLGGAGDGEFQC